MKYGYTRCWRSDRWRKVSGTIPSLYDHSSNLILPSTQYDMYSSENAGLVKFDLLGLKTLTVIDKTIKRLKTKKIDLNISEIDQKMKKFSLFCQQVKQQVCFS